MVLGGGGYHIYLSPSQVEDTQAKENKPNSYIIVEEERTYDLRIPDHALISAPARRTSRDPTSYGIKDRIGDNARAISQ